MLRISLLIILIGSGAVSLAQESKFGVSVPRPTDSTLLIGSFNIQNFGKTKMRNKPLVVDTLVAICLQYDVVAIQEISHKNGDTPDRFLDSLNAHSNSPYKMIISERSGLQTDDKSSQEQYGFYYNSKKIQQLDEGVLYADDEHDYFQREPYLARFQAVNESFDFVLITAHTAPAKSENPDITKKEVSALNEVVKWAKKHYPNEEDFIVLGDFNADCSYLKESEIERLEIYKDYSWLIPHSAKTTLAKTRDCTYDRIVITPECDDSFTGKWGVDRYFSSKKVSDHWPVWAEFWVN